VFDFIDFFLKRDDCLQAIDLVGVMAKTHHFWGRFRLKTTGDFVVELFGKP
jgi:hypothetical protein